MKAALYARVSTSQQTADNQLIELRRYVEARGWTAVEFVDQGVSGSNDRRPALDALLKDANGRRLAPPTRTGYRLSFATPATRNRPAEPLWNFWGAGVTWSCELWFHGASYGWEAQILRNGDLFMARSALVTKPAAVQCAEEMRNGGEKGYLEAVEIGEQRSRSVGQSSTIAVELARVFDANAIQNGI